MKNIKVLFAAMAALVLAVSCQKYDDTPIKERLDKVESRVSSLESAVTALQAAVDGKYAVDKMEKTDNGYKIYFTNGKTIELLNGKDGVDGKDGDNGKDGDSFLQSITETAEAVVIVLNDETSTTFTLPKAVTIKIGGEETVINVTACEEVSVPVAFPDVEFVTIAATVVAENGSTSAFLTKSENVSGWTVKLDAENKAVVLVADMNNIKEHALLQVNLVKADGTTYTASKALFVSNGYVEYGGRKYNVTKMKDGNVWFAENLTYVPEGKAIAELADSYTQGAGDGIFYPATLSIVEGKGVATPSSDAAAVAAQGLLYTAAAIGIELPSTDWTDAEQTQGICPKGWHIPTAQEWVNLVGACSAGAHTNADAPYYDKTLSGAPLEALNEDGLNFLPYPYLNAGKTYLATYSNKREDSIYNQMGAMGYFHSSTGRSATQSYAAMITNNNTKSSVNCAYNNLTNAIPVRCIRNK